MSDTTIIVLCYAIPLGALAAFIVYMIGYSNGRCDAIHSRITYDLKVRGFDRCHWPPTPPPPPLPLPPQSPPAP